MSLVQTPPGGGTRPAPPGAGPASRGARLGGRGLARGLRDRGLARGLRCAAALLAASLGVLPAAAQAATSGGAPPTGGSLGPNVNVFTPSMPQSSIQSTLNTIYNQQTSNQFGTQRYALLFEPGTYGSAADPLDFSGRLLRGASRAWARTRARSCINGTIDSCQPVLHGSSTHAYATDNFWRSLSNLTINVAGQHRLLRRRRLLGGVAGRADAAGGHQRQPRR